MFSKQLANPANPKTETSVNPIALIKVGLVDPRRGIVAPSEPEVIVQETKKMTLSEKICFTVTFIIFIGGFVGIIFYLKNSGTSSGAVRHDHSAKRSQHQTDHYNEKQPNSVSSIDVDSNSTYLNNTLASTKCPQACQNYNMKWNGRWSLREVNHTRSIPVCSCGTLDSNTVAVEVELLTSDQQAQNRCPLACESSRAAEFSGSWLTVINDVSSVCLCNVRKIANNQITSTNTIQTSRN